MINKDFYKNILYNSPTGYAYHKVIYDRNKKPVDYVFLEVNAAFEHFTGLKAQDILNKAITIILPEIKNDETDWINKYGLLALNHSEIEFDSFSTTLNRFYRVKAFSPEEGYFITLFSDISVNKTLERQISHEQALVKKYWNAADVLFIVLKSDGMIEAVNRKGCEILGLGEKDILGKNWFDEFLPQHVKDDIKEVFNKIINNQIENVEFYENAVVDANGNEHIIAFHNTVLEDDFGNISSILSAGNDITEQRHAEAELIESEEKFRYIFDNSAIGKTLIFPDGTIDVNNTLCKLLQYLKKDLDGKDWLAYTYKDDLDVNKKAAEALFSGRKDYVQFETRYVKKDGTVLWAEVHSRVRNDSKGTPMYLISSIIDISERKKAAADLDESQAIFKAAFDNSKAGIAVADAPDGKLRYINKAALLIGNNSLTNESLENINFHEYIQSWNLFHLDGSPYKTEEVPLTRAVLYGEEVSEEIVVKKDGHEDKILLANAVPIRDKNNHVVAGIVVLVDISERRKLEEERRTLEDRLHQQQRLESIGILAGGVAHEINNPINGIMNYSQLILDGSNPKSEIANYASEIIHETNRVTAIVRNLLQFSRNDKQEHSYANIEDIIHSTTSLIKTVMKQDQITLETYIPNNLPKIKCRSQQVQQVIMNLLTNARDALNEKYAGYHKNKVIDLSCELFSRDKRNWIRIIVKDHGNGIPEDVQPNIFNPFYTTKGRDKGTGLGLSISYGIVKDHHGSLTFTTKQGKNTKFFLELPVDNGWDLDAET